MIDALASTGSKVLDEIAAVIGVRAALDLGVEFRGERIYIPQDPAKLPQLAKVIGDDRAKALCEAMWGTKAAIPVRVVLHHKVKQMADEGSMTKRAIARHLKIREVQVYEILRRWREDEAQPRLL